MLYIFSRKKFHQHFPWWIESKAKSYLMCLIIKFDKAVFLANFSRAHRKHESGHGQIGQINDATQTGL